MIRRYKVGEVVNQNEYQTTTVSSITDSPSQYLVRFKTEHNKEYVDKTNEKYGFKHKLPYVSYSSSKHSKVLCVNGPSRNKYLIPEDAEGYQRYNVSYSPRNQSDTKFPHAVLVWME